MRISALLAVAVLGVSSLAAHADTVALFDVNAVLTNGGTLTGTLDLDSNNIFDTTVDMTYNNNGVKTFFTGSDEGYGLSLSAGQLQFDNAALVLDFQLATPFSFVGYNGGALCSDTVACSAFGPSMVADLNLNPAQVFDVSSGTLTPAAVTPEPSSVVLLGTGALSAVGLVRRRLVRG